MTVLSIDTRSLAIATSIASSVSSVSLMGYASPGDPGVGANYTRVVVAPSHPGKFQSADGAWWELITEKPHPGFWGGQRCTLAQVAAGTAFDNQAAFTNAVSYAIAKDLICYIPVGHWFTGSPIDVQTGLIGDGIDVSFLHYPVNTGAIYCVASPSAFRDSATIQAFTVYGPLLSNFLSVVAPSTEIAVRFAYYSKVFSDIKIIGSRHMALRISSSGYIEIPNHIAMFCARDGLNLTGCGNINVGRVVGRHLDDDIFAASTESTAVTAPSADILATPPFSNRSITVGTIDGVDTKGPRFLGAVNTTVGTIHMTRPKEHGGVFGGTVGTEGLTDPKLWDVGLWVVNDLIDGASITAAGGINNSTDYHFGFLGSTSTSNGGGTTAVPPGRFDTGTGSFIKPDGYTNATNSSANIPKGGFFNGSLKAKFRNTLPSTGHYSDWGVGLCFTSVGWIDPVRTAHMRGGTLIKANTLNFSFDNIDIDMEGYGFNNGFDFSGTNGNLARIRIKANLVRCAGDAIVMGTFANTDGSGQAHIGESFDLSGHFDLDPYFEHSNRGAGGTWTSNSIGPFVFNYGAGNRMNNLNAHDCVMRNLVGFSNDTADIRSGQMGNFYNNTYICQPTTANAGADTETSSNNKGVRLLACSATSRFVFEYSDPTQANYGSRINGIGGFEASSIPTTGFFYQGHVVQNRLLSIIAENGQNYYLVGWKRLSTGSNHVLGTDWTEIKTPIGSAMPSSKTANYTLSQADDGTTIEMNSGSGLTLTLPNNLSVGTTVDVIQVGTGQVAASPAAGATLVNRQGFTKTAGQWAAIRLQIIGNTGGSAAKYLLAGDGAV